MKDVTPIQFSYYGICEEGANMSGVWPISYITLNGFPG